MYSAYFCPWCGKYNNLIVSVLLVGSELMIIIFGWMQQKNSEKK